MTRRGWSRRGFLKATGIGAGAAAAFAIVGLPRKSAIAAPFGEFPDAAKSKMLPAANQAKRVLEVFLYGGLSPWETMYLVPDYGTPSDPTYPNTMFYTFPATGPDSVAAALSACGVPGTAPTGVDFAQDELGKTVQLGPFAYPLRNRADVTARMRLLVQKHDLEPHEAAIPYALSGKRVGTPTLAGLGTHIQRYFTDRPDPARQAPYSYVFSTGSFFAPSDNILAATAIGAHPGRARPLRIKVDAGQRLTDLLNRTKVGTLTQRQQYDAMLQVYQSQYASRLTWNKQGQPVRAAKYADLTSAVSAVSNADAVASVLDPSFFQTTPDTICTDTNDANVPAMSLKLAAHLLTHPTQAARYCCVVDTGLIEASGGGGYDTHTYNSHDQARNYKNLLDHLLAIINQPGEGDPTKIDLDDTLVILNTEFGRTPTAQDGGNGRNHHPYGYVTTLIGGPITVDQAGIHGAIGPDGKATTALTPGENRIAALLAMGIWPLSPEAFNVSDIQGGIDEPGAIGDVTQRALGYTL